MAAINKEVSEKLCQTMAGKLAPPLNTKLVERAVDALLNHVERNKKLEKPFALLRKPFGKAELSRQLRIQLDARVENIHRATA